MRRRIPQARKDGLLRNRCHPKTLLASAWLKPDKVSPILIPIDRMTVPYFISFVKMLGNMNYLDWLEND